MNRRTKLVRSLDPESILKAIILIIATIAMTIIIIDVAMLAI